MFLGGASPLSAKQGDWCDPAREKWLILLSGRAELEFERGGKLRLGPGEYLTIPAGCRHRVSWTDPAQGNVWLAVHYPAAASR